ncbi:MAG: hypothetical protein ACKO14_03575 [Armatimonadota bacterium]
MKLWKLWERPRCVLNVELLLKLWQLLERDSPQLWKDGCELVSLYSKHEKARLLATADA